MTRLYNLFLVLTIGAVTSCASAIHGGGSDQHQRNLITSQQLRDLQTQYDDMYAVIRSLRGNWLRSRGSVSIQDASANEPVVFRDSNEYGEIESLRDFSPSDVSHVEYLNGREATTRYGTGYAGGIIVLVTR